MEFKTFTVSITKKGKITIKKKKGQVLLNAIENIEHLGYDHNRSFFYKELVLVPNAPLGSKIKID